MPRRWAPALPAVVLVVFALVFQPVWWANVPGGGARGFKAASAGALFQGIQVGDRAWIDDAVDGGRVAVLWSGVPDRFVVNQNEFFNRSVGPVYYVGAPTPGGLAETEVTKRESDGTYRTAEGKAVRGPYVLVHDSIAPDGVAGRARPRARDDPVAHRRPARRDDDDGRGHLPRRHLVGEDGDVDARALQRRHARRRDHERPGSSSARIRS